MHQSVFSDGKPGMRNCARVCSLLSPYLYGFPKAWYGFSGSEMIANEECMKKMIHMIGPVKWLAMAVVLGMFVSSFLVFSLVCPCDVDGFKVCVAILFGTFGRFVIGGYKYGFNPFDMICVSMVLCSAICFFGPRGLKSEGCLTAFFLMSWVAWFLCALSYLCYWI